MRRMFGRTQIPRMKSENTIWLWLSTSLEILKKFATGHFLVLVGNRDCFWGEDNTILSVKLFCPCIWLPVRIICHIFSYPFLKNSLNSHSIHKILPDNFLPCYGPSYFCTTVIKWRTKFKWPKVLTNIWKSKNMLLVDAVRVIAFPWPVVFIQVPQFN